MEKAKGTPMTNGKLFGILTDLAHEDGYCVVIVTYDDELVQRAVETLRLRDGRLI